MSSSNRDLDLYHEAKLLRAKRELLMLDPPKPPPSESASAKSTAIHQVKALVSQRPVLSLALASGLGLLLFNKSALLRSLLTSLLARIALQAVRKHL